MVGDVELPRVGVFGSLCNPMHVGHLVLCQEAIAQLALSRVIVVPTGLPPHRPAPREDAETRLRLARAASGGNPLLTISRVELERPGPSYMTDTLRDLANRYPGADLVLLLGADQLAGLAGWHEPEALPRLARLAVARRPGAVIRGEEGAAVDWIDMPLLSISSSGIRRRVAEGRPIRYLVPEPVRELIEAEGLYRTPDDEGGEPDGAGTGAERPPW